VNPPADRTGAIDVERGEVIGWSSSTHCKYFARRVPQVSMPGCASRDRLVESSARDRPVRADAEFAAACGHFVHVYVDRATGRP